MTSLIKKSVTVRQIGGTLVAAFDTADPPLIWKFDLERNHSFALALQGKDGGWELGVTSAKNEFHPVARFRSRDDAEEAFSKTQQALMVKPGNRWRTAVISFMVVIALLIVIVILPLIKLAHNFSAHMQAAMGRPAAATSGQMKDGEPIDADQALKPPP